jgi:putative transposase
MDWSHAPLHRTENPGWYFLTGGTYLKRPYLVTGDRRASFISLIASAAEEFNVELQAWVALINHYHLMILATEPASIAPFVRKIHSVNARELNALDQTPGRKVWFQYHDKWIDSEKAYFSRINYIHQNPVHHGIVDRAENYRWSSLRVFEDRVGTALAKTVRSFRTDSLNVVDDY